MPPSDPERLSRSPDNLQARMIPYIVGCALFMQMLDATVVAIALPAMAKAFDTTAVRMNILITTYLLTVAVFVPISGWAADRFGAKRVFQSAILLFTLSSTACALAPTMSWLITARAFQGLAGAMMVPVGRVILLRTVPKSRLVNAMSLLSMPALIGPVIGPLLGGMLVTYASWHWIFLINIPIGILGLVLVHHFIRESGTLDRTPLDLPGFLLSAICLASLVSAFDALGHGSLSPLQLLLLVGVGVACGLLYMLHARHAAHPIIDLRLMRLPSFRIATLGGNLCRFAVGGSPFLLVLLLQVGFGRTAMEAGMVTFAGAAGALLMKLVATPLIKRYGFRRVLSVNALLTGLFIVACAAFTASTPSWVMIAILLLGGFFRSLQFTGVNSLTYAEVGHADMSRASSFAAMAQQLGISLGVGVAAATINVSMRLRGDTNLAQPDIMAGFIAIGLLCVASALSFRRLPADAGAQLEKRNEKREG